MRKILVIIFLLLTQIGYSQDTVVFNSGFEENIVPTYNTYRISEINTLWFSAWNSPDIFSYYYSDAGLSIPINLAGHQNAFKDSSYSGFSTYTRGITGSPIREWLGIKLPQNLDPNDYYCFKAYISLADTFNFATGNIGIYFSEDSIYMELPPQATPLPTDYSYVVSTPVNQIFSNHNGWAEINLFYQAKGIEQYMYIGNFCPDSLINYQYVGTDNDSTFGIAYYYIDEVTLYKCDGVGIDENPRDIIDIYPNPAQDFVSIDIPENYQNPQFSIYNLTGQLISQKQITPTNQQIPITELGNGMYIFVIQNGDKVIGRHRVVVAR